MVSSDPEEAIIAARKAIAVDSSFAPAWLQLGNALGRAGRPEEALEVSQTAANLFRKQAQDRPDEVMPNLAKSLNNMGFALAHSGRREEALLATQESVGIFRKLNQDHPDTFVLNLAISLNNLGGRLVGLGRHEDALQATREAVDLCHKLTEDNLDAFSPFLAMSLDTLGRALAYQGRWEEALLATQDALDLYRRLAQDPTAAFTPDLAASLYNVGKLLVEVHRSDEALPIFAELLAGASLCNIEELTSRTVQLAIRLAARGFGAHLLTAIEASPVAASLEPLIVALQRYLGRETHAPLEIYEIAKDLIKDIEAMKAELETEGNQGAGTTL